MTLLDRAIVRLLPVVPKPVVQLFSSRYIAGSTLDDAVRVVRRLNAEGMTATIDVLGEEIASDDEARAIARAYGTSSPRSSASSSTRTSASSSLRSG